VPAGAIAATFNLASSQILAAGRVDLLTKVELLFQPFRAVLIVIAALLFNTTMACALALVAALVVQLPMVYVAKGRCVPNDYRALLGGLWHSAQVSVACLALPAALAVLASNGRGTPMGVLAFVAAIVSCVGCWLLAVVRLRHPLSSDTVFERLTAPWLRRVRRRPGD